MALFGLWQDEIKVEDWNHEHTVILCGIANADITNKAVLISDDDYSPECLNGLRMDLLYYFNYIEQNDKVINKLILAARRNENDMFDQALHLQYELLVLCRNNLMSDARRKLKQFIFEIRKMELQLDGSTDRDEIMQNIEDTFSDYPDVLDGVNLT